MSQRAYMEGLLHAEPGPRRRATVASGVRNGCVAVSEAGTTRRNLNCRVID